MGKDRVVYLLEQYSAGQATKDEVEELFRILPSAEAESTLKDLIVGQALDPKDEEPEILLPSLKWEQIWQNIRSATLPPTRQMGSSRNWVRVAAAVIILGTGVGIFQLFHQSRNNKTRTLAKADNQQILPGGNKAVLTLANGATIVLDSAHDGVIGQQGNTDIVKVDAGALAYDAKSKHQGQVLYNAITTPRGGQYQVVLPDGSRVWLNAASSLRFPTSFVGTERMVELTGEAYFEIARNPAMPFRVSVKPPPGSNRNPMNVEVLGTNFNVKAYENEQSIRTTLLEGAVKVSIPAENQAVTLNPGRQAIAANETASLDVQEVNLEQVVAWKNGMFRFKETNIRELMREVERWYNVDVIYDSQKKDQDFTGIVPRTRNITELLHMLELTGTVHFQIEGRKIIVLP